MTSSSRPSPSNTPSEPSSSPTSILIPYNPPQGVVSCHEKYQLRLFASAEYAGSGSSSSRRSLFKHNPYAKYSSIALVNLVATPPTQLPNDFNSSNTENQMQHDADFSHSAMHHIDPATLGFIASHTASNGKSYIRYVTRQELYQRELDSELQPPSSFKHGQSQQQQQHLNQNHVESSSPAGEMELGNDTTEPNQAIQQDHDQHELSSPTSEPSLQPSSSSALSSPLPEKDPNATLYKLLKNFSSSNKHFIINLDRCPEAPQKCLYAFSRGDVGLYEQVTIPGTNPHSGPIRTSFQARRFNAKQIDNSNVTCVKWYNEHIFFAMFESGFVYVFDDRLEDESMPLTNAPSRPVATSDKDSSPTEASSGKQKNLKNNIQQKNSKETTSRRIQFPEDHLKSAAPHQWKNQKGCNPLYRLDIGESVTINDASISPDKYFLALACSDGFLRIYDLRDPNTFKLHVAFRSLFGAVRCCCWTHDGNYLIAGGEDDYISVYGIEEKALLARGEGHESFVNRVCSDANFEDETCYRLVSCGQDGQVFTWEMEPPVSLHSSSQNDSPSQDNSSHNRSSSTENMDIKKKSVAFQKRQQSTEAHHLEVSKTGSKASEYPLMKEDLVKYPRSLKQIPVFDPVDSIRSPNGPIWDCGLLGDDVITIDHRGVIEVTRFKNSVPLFEMDD